MASRKYHIGPSRIHGNGLIASRNLLPEDIIGPTHQNDKNHENKSWFYNHSKTPNARSVKVGNERYLIPSYRIKKGEEITIDYRFQPELEQPEDFNKEKISPKNVHDAADEAGIPWDNDESFMRFSKEVTGKEHIDKMTSKQRENLITNIKSLRSPVDSKNTHGYFNFNPAEGAVGAGLGTNFSGGWGAEASGNTPLQANPYYKGSVGVKGSKQVGPWTFSGGVNKNLLGGFNPTFGAKYNFQDGGSLPTAQDGYWEGEISKWKMDMFLDSADAVKHGLQTKDWAEEGMIKKVADHNEDYWARLFGGLYKTYDKSKAEYLGEEPDDERRRTSTAWKNGERDWVGKRGWAGDREKDFIGRRTNTFMKPSERRIISTSPSLSQEGDEGSAWTYHLFKKPTYPKPEKPSQDGTGTQSMRPWRPSAQFGEIKNIRKVEPKPHPGPVEVREERPAIKKGSVWEQKGAPNAGSTYWTAVDSSGGKRAIPKHEYERAQKFSPDTVLEPTNFYDYKYGGSLPKAQEGNGGTYYTSDPNDPRFQAYTDSLNAYNQGERYYEYIGGDRRGENTNIFSGSLSDFRDPEVNWSNSAGRNLVPTEYFGSSFRSATSVHEEDIAKDPESYPYRDKGMYIMAARFKKPTQEVRLSKMAVPVEVREERPKTKNSIQYTKRGPGLHQSEYEYWDAHGDKHFITPAVYNSLKTQGLKVLKQGGSLPKAQIGNGDSYTLVPTEEGYSTRLDSQWFEDNPNWGVVSGTEEGNLSYKLPPATISAKNPYGPYFNTLRDEEKKWLIDNRHEKRRFLKDINPITRSLRAKAKIGYGVGENQTFGESVSDWATGSLTAVPKMLGQTLQTPQSLMVEGIEAARGNDYSFMDALPGDPNSTTQRRPDEIVSWEENTPWYDKAAFNIITDPLNIFGVGLIDDAFKLGIRGMFKKGTTMPANYATGQGAKQIKKIPSQKLLDQGMVSQLPPTPSISKGVVRHPLSKYSWKSPDVDPAIPLIDELGLGASNLTDVSRFDINALAAINKMRPAAYNKDRLNYLLNQYHLMNKDAGYISNLGEYAARNPTAQFTIPNFTNMHPELRYAMDENPNIFTLGERSLSGDVSEYTKNMMQYGRGEGLGIEGLEGWSPVHQKKIELDYIVNKGLMDDLVDPIQNTGRFRADPHRGVNQHNYLMGMTGKYPSIIASGDRMFTSMGKSRLGEGLATSLANAWPGPYDRFPAEEIRWLLGQRALKEGSKVRRLSGSPNFANMLDQSFGIGPSLSDRTFMKFARPKSTYQQGGSLPRAQNGNWEKYDQVFTYENNPEWFDNQARYHDNQDYSNIIKEKVYAGTHGYNPSTGALHKLDVPVHIPPATQEMATEEWGRKSHQERFESPTPAGKSVRKGHVGRSMQDVFENPITYVPGAVASLPYMAGMGAAAYPTAARYGSLLFNSPLSMAGRTLGPTIPTIAGSTSPVWTAGNMVGAGFIGHGLTNIVPDTKDLIKDPSLAGALDVGVDLLETSPLWIPPVIRGVNALRQLPAPSFSSVLPSKGYTPPRIIDDLIPKPAYVVPQYGGSSSQSSRSNEQLIKEIEAMQSYFLKGRGKTKSVADTDDLLMDLAKEQGLRKELIKTTSQSKVSNIQKQLGEHREVVNKKLYEGTYGDASITGSYEGNLKGIETLFKQKMNEGYMHEMNLAINKNTADFARMDKVGHQYPFFTRYDRTKPFQLSKHPDDIFNLRKNLYEYGPLSPNNLPEVLAERKIIIDQDLHMTYAKNKFHSKMERLRDQVGAGFDNVVPMTPGSNIARNFPRSNYAMKQADKIQKEYIQALQADASARTGPFGGPRSDMLSPTKTSFFDEGIENLRWSLDRNVPHPGPLYQHRTPIKGTQNWSNFIDDHSFFLGSGATSRNASGQLGSRVINTHITPLESPGLEGPSRYIWPDNPLFFGGLNQQGGELSYAQQGGVPTYQSQLDYESLNRFDVDYNTFKGGKSVILPKKVGIDRLHTRDRAEEIFAGLATKFPDANKIYSPGQLEESGFAEEYYDLYKYTKMYKDTMNKYNSTAGQDEFGQGDTTPLKEQQIGRLHEDFFTKGMGPRRVASSEEAAHIALLKSENRLQQGGSIPSYQGASDAPQMQDIYKTGNFPKPQEIKQESPTEETQAATIDLNNLDMDEALIVYRDYIEGIYDGTPDELIAEKVYDKLNRIFYKKAKEQGMSAPNYIMSTIKG